jgi:hypothetical protein
LDDLIEAASIWGIAWVGYPQINGEPVSQRVVDEIIPSIQIVAASTLPEE